MAIFTTIKGKDVIELSVGIPIKHDGTIDDFDVLNAVKARLQHMDVLIGSGETAQPDGEEGGNVASTDGPADQG